MNCVFYGNKQPNGFEEQFSYSREMPYTIYIKDFPAADIVPLHYAKTIEILMCDNLEGECVIDGIRYDMSGQKVFFIPPYTVHSTTIYPCSGRQYVFCISPLDMDNYLNIANYLDSCGCCLNQLAHDIDAYAEIAPLITRMIENHGEIAACLPDIAALFRIFSTYIVQADESSVLLHHNSMLLQNVVRWTQGNYMNKVTLEDVAHVSGYSKSYFCNRFKEATGITYSNYLNMVRILHACLFLRKGLSVQSVSTMCGLENPSYFAQVFKKIKHMTPRQYLNQCANTPDIERV